jgi:hypothetical protein
VFLGQQPQGWLQSKEYQDSPQTDTPGVLKVSYWYLVSKSSGFSLSLSCNLFMEIFFIRADFMKFKKM